MTHLPSATGQPLLDALWLEPSSGLWVPILCMGTGSANGSSCTR